MKKLFASAMVLSMILSVTMARKSRDYRTEISSYYGIAPATAVVYDNQLGGWGDVATALFISRITGLSPERVIQLRRQGSPYVVIADEYGVPPGAYYVPVTDVPVLIYKTKTRVLRTHAPPYGYAWGYYRNHGWWKHSRDWGKDRGEDDQGNNDDHGNRGNHGHKHGRGHHD